MHPNTRHGLHKTTEHRAWRNMRYRCENPKASNYALYGGKGICVCVRWQTFENFYLDMGPKPDLKHSIERKDGNGNYEPGNCIWATAKVQANNTSRNITLTHGKTTKTVEAWSVSTGIPTECIRRRIDRGWSLELALTTPPRTYKGIR